MLIPWFFKSRHLLGVCLSVTLGVVHAAFPDRPIKLVTPFPAGGTVDAVARTLAAQWSVTLNTPVVVDTGES